MHFLTKPPPPIVRVQCSAGALADIAFIAWLFEIEKNKLQSMLNIPAPSLLCFFLTVDICIYQPRVNQCVCFSGNLPSQCGFFQRAQPDDSVPRYHAVRIRKETPECKDGKVKLDPFEKKQWMTTWIENESYS